MECSIRSWHKLDGTWEVTIHRDKPNMEHLYDVPSLFRRRLTQEAAEAYVISLFRKYAISDNHVTVEFPESFGQESKTIGFGGGHCWEYYDGQTWGAMYEDGKVEWSLGEEK